MTGGLTLLPDSLEKAIALTENSAFVKKVISEELLAKYLSTKKAEASDFAAAEDKSAFYKKRYFKFI